MTLLAPAIQSPAIQPYPVCPRTVKQVQVGGLYRIKGSCHNTEPTLDSVLTIPPQVVLIKSRALQNGVYGVPYWRVELWADLGQGGKYHWPETILFADQVNIPEHGTHDRHLEKVEDRLALAFKQMYSENMKDDYEEMVA